MMPKSAPTGGSHAMVLPSDGLKIDELVDDLVKQAFHQANGNQSQAARLLGWSRDQLRHRLQKLNILSGRGASHD